MSVRFLQPKKAYIPIDVTLSGILIEARLLHPLNESSSKDDTFSVKITLSREEQSMKSAVVLSQSNKTSFKLEQPLNQWFTLYLDISLGTQYTETEVRLLQSENALSLIIDKFAGSVNEFRLLQPEKALSPIDVKHSGKLIETRLLQPSKAKSSIFVTPLPIIIEVKLLQPLKASLPILLTLSGIDTEVKLLHPRNNPELIEVNPSEIVADSSLSQSIKTLPPILFIVPGIEIEVSPQL